MLQNNKKVLVTGGGGYIGYHVVQALVSLGHKVQVIDNGSHAPHVLVSIADRAKLSLAVEDIRDKNSTRHYYDGCSAVYHLAAIVGAAACDADRSHAWSVNVEGTEIVATSAAEAGVPAFVMASTCSVYGTTSGFVDEQSAISPKDFYSETKIAGEQIVTQRHAQFASHILRLSTAFGVSARMRTDLLLNTMTHDAVRHGKITVRNAESWRPVVHCKNIAQVCAAALNWKPHEFVLLNVGLHNHTIGDLASCVSSMVPDCNIVLDNNRNDERTYRVCFRKSESLIDPQEILTIAAGVAEMIQWL